MVYRVGDRYKRSALQQLNYFLRDFRTGDAVAMDPQVLDILYDIKAHLGDTEARYEILSAYRSPKTNDLFLGQGGFVRAARRESRWWTRRSE